MSAEGAGAARPNPFSKMLLEGEIIERLRTVYDPEIPVSIYEMGLVYAVEIADGGEVTIRMTLTSPMCPVAESLPIEVEEKVRSVDGVTNVTIDLVWEPVWTPEMMTDAARLELGFI
jgi:FeS assembly SUF system protein